MKALLTEHGRTFADEAGIRLRDTPQPLYQLLVLSHLLSARIRTSVAVAAAQALFAHDMRTPRHMLRSTWQQRVDALGEGGYRRYDEKTATQLAEGAELLLEEYGGDLRRLRRSADGDLDALRSGLRRTPGMGPVGANIFLREAQAVWPEAAPYLDKKALQGAEKLGLPASPEELAQLAEQARPTGPHGPAVLAAALVRAALDQDLVADLRAHP
ncbi:endonuclease [Streptomyces laculatispora]|uniref:endonuclease n=1 Tax=Streptomyces laculatispora TaxID=887464 RepID=UPI001A94DE74|nr:endonuclease [Streptomyces laculatispora]MBO0915445.1 endonuclease [Streptomyces laculatispora]